MEFSEEIQEVFCGFGVDRVHHRVYHGNQLIRRVPMQLVHEIKCVDCSKIEYVPVDPGQKTARSMKGICDPCMEVRNGETAKADESKAKQSSVPSRTKS